MRRSHKQTGNMSLTSETDLGLDTLELGDRGPAGAGHSVAAEGGGGVGGGRDAKKQHQRGASGRSRDAYGPESEDLGMLTKGIVVTNEVTITYTQEEMIERIVGF